MVRLCNLYKGIQKYHEILIRINLNKANLIEKVLTCIFGIKKYSPILPLIIIESTEVVWLTLTIHNQIFNTVI